jgi:hypothetical protein
MRTTTAFTDSEKWSLIKIMDCYPEDDECTDPKREPDWGGAHKTVPGSPNVPFRKAYEAVAKEFDRLETMDARTRFTARAKQALSLGTVKRSNWPEAREFLVLHAKLLQSFGFATEALAPAVAHVTGAAGSDEGKNAQLFHCILSLPVGVIQAPCRDIGRIMPVLDGSLYGMERVKREIRLQMVLLAHAHGMPRSVPLLLVGPPGTGKTSVARAIASALGLPFASVALGGNCDPLLFRGSQYAWSSATPGFFARALMGTGCLNPCILLDEVDKAGSYGHGDVIDALTEVFDPNQADHFKDLFLLDIPLDLSRVLWICTANDLHRVPSYIVDRCKVIEVPQYREEERKTIIREYLPAQLRAQLNLGFAIEVADGVVAQLAKQTDSLRVAARALVDLIALELESKTPGAVKRLIVKTWDPSVLPSPEGEDAPRQIGFAVPEPRDDAANLRLDACG